MRVALMWLSWWCEWRPVLAVVQPETCMRWRCPGVRWCWHGTLSPGRPPISVELPGRIRPIAYEHLMWGQRHITIERRLKLGLRVSPRTVYT